MRLAKTAKTKPHQGHLRVRQMVRNMTAKEILKQTLKIKMDIAPAKVAVNLHPKPAAKLVIKV